jgi:hypothetical protein
MSEKLQPYAAHDPSYGLVTGNLFYSGLTFSGWAHKTGSKKYLSKATALAKQRRQISRTKGLNALHTKSLLMEAEVLAYKCKKLDRLLHAYEEGITAAVKVGYTQDMAIGSEIAARQFLNQARDPYQEVRSP